MPLSTPIQNLPSANQASGNAAPPEDPEVLKIIEDMEQEVAAEVKGQQPPPPAPRAIPPPPIPVYVPKKTAPPSLWSWNQQNATRAVAATLLAMVLFYPRTLELVYQRLPEAYQVLARSYDTLLRAGLLAIALYVLMWKFQV